MLRLVVCAPGRPRGPDCRLDLQHHLVLSFRAFVGDVQVSSWRGLTGSYPSRLFALPLGQVIDEYTKVEVRGLRSVPLALSREEIAALATRAAQLHWSYDGRYYFVSNNCAVETGSCCTTRCRGWLRCRCRASVPMACWRGCAKPARPPRRRCRPMPMNRHGSATGSIRPAPTTSRCMRSRAPASTCRRPTPLPGWRCRRPRARLRCAGMGLEGAAALLVLESAALRRQEALARDELKRRWLRDARLPQAAADIAEPLREFLRLGGAFSRPASWLHDVPGYGLPQAGERGVLAARVRADAGSRQAQAEALETVARRLLSPERRAALEGTDANVALIGERLRALAGAGP